MKKRGVYAFLAVLAAVASVALMLAFVVIPGGTEGVKSPAVSIQEVASAPGGPAEGIAVHGHWTIEVRNPDGTLAERREFENALMTTGPWQLAELLGRQKSMGGWLVLLGGTAWEGSSWGWISESTYDVIQPWIFKTLTVSVPSTGTNAHKVVLSGTATAQRDGNVGNARTAFSTISPSQPPSATYGGSLDFTETAFTPVHVTIGQEILVTVVISFS